MVGVIRFDRKSTCLRIASSTDFCTEVKARRLAWALDGKDCTSRTLSSGAVRDGEWTARRACTK